jgi:hypothetical protein
MACTSSPSMRIGDWVTNFLDEQTDVPERLAAHSGVAERHAFIWATRTSDVEVQAQLQLGDDHPSP